MRFVKIKEIQQNICSTLSNDSLTLLYESCSLVQLNLNSMPGKLHHFMLLKVTHKLEGYRTRQVVFRFR